VLKLGIWKQQEQRTFTHTGATLRAFQPVLRSVFHASMSVYRGQCRLIPHCGKYNSNTSFTSHSIIRTRLRVPYEAHVVRYDPESGPFKRFAELKNGRKGSVKRPMHQLKQVVTSRCSKIRTTWWAKRPEPPMSTHARCGRTQVLRTRASFIPFPTQRMYAWQRGKVDVLQHASPEPHVLRN
jgi:hypothetical protein